MKKIAFVELDLIDLPVREMRIDRNQDYAKDLAESIRKNGILQPLLLRPKGERFEVRDGCSRLLAARSLGLSKVPALVRDATDREAVIFTMHGNLCRENPDSVAEARFIASSITELKMDVPEFAEILGRSVQYIEDRLTIAEMPPYLQAALKQKELPLGVALILTQIDSEQTRQDWTFSAIRDGMTVEAAKNALKQYRGLQQGAARATSPDEVPVIPVAPPALMVACAKCGEAMVLTECRVVRIHRGECVSGKPTG